MFSRDRAVSFNICAYVDFKHIDLQLIELIERTLTVWMENASYIDSWLDTLRRLKRLIFVSASVAQ